MRERIAAVGLNSAWSDSIRGLSEAEWKSLIARLDASRLSGLLVDAISSGRLDASPQQRHDAERLHRQVMTRVLLLDRLALEIYAELDQYDIEVRLLKGCAHAHLLYPDPTLRPYVDVDLLVRGTQFGAAVVALERLGITRPTPELRPGFDRRFGKGATLRTESGFGVDLHRTFVAGPFAMTVDADRLFERSEIVEVGGRGLAALAGEERFLHSCFHAAISDREPSLLSLRDVVQGLDPQLDAGHVLEVATDWHALAVVAKAINSAWNVLKPDVRPDLVAWAQSYRPTSSEKRVMASYEATDRRWARQSIAALPAVKGLGNKASYLFATVVPTAEARSGRGDRTGVGHLRRVVSASLRRRRG